MTLSAQGHNYRRPDFAYPKTVCKDATDRLKTELEKGNELGALRAMMDLALASNEISSDRMPAVLAEIDSITQQMKNPDIASLCYLLQARIYSDIYNSERFRINQRPASSGENTDDYTTWSASRFFNRVTELCNAAMAEERALLRRKLADYSLVVEANSLTLTYYPRLYDFVANEVVRILRSFSTQQAVGLANEIMEQRTEYSRGITPAYTECRISVITADDSLSAEEKFGRLKELFEEIEKSPYRVEVALAMNDLTYGNIEREKIVYPILDSMVKEYPSSPRFNCLVNAVASISRPTVRTSIPYMASPDIDLNFQVTAENVSEVTVTFYKIPDSAQPDENFYRPSKISSLVAVATSTVKFQGTIPFEAAQKGSVRLPEIGKYIAIAKAPGIKDSNESYRIIQCSRLATSVISFDKSSALVVNPVSGQPVTGAEILWLPQKKIARPIAETDSMGLAAVNLETDGNIKAVKDNDKYSGSIWFSPRHNPQNRKRTYLEGFTSLAVYRPGDSVQWVFMGYQLEGKNYTLLRDSEITVVMRDANYQSVDTFSGKTDAYGRIAGSFTLPKVGLTGRFTLRASSGIGKDEDDWNDGASSTISFMVSDYKMPTFKAEITDIATGVPEKGAVTLKGVATTYSGMPVASASVEVKIEKVPMWWRFESQMFEPVIMKAETDADGRWSLVVPAEKLSGAGENAFLRANVAVTSLSGEMQHAERNFSIGSPLRIIAEIPRAINVCEPQELKIKVVDSADSTVNTVVNYQVVDGEKIVASGKLQTPDSLRVDWKEIPTGTYDLKFSTSEDSLTVQEVAIYRPDDRVSPSKNILWTPTDIQILGPDNEAEILLGTRGLTHVLMTVWDGEGVYRQEWLDLERGIHPIKVKGPHGASNLTATFIAVRDMESERLDVTLKSAVNPRELRLQISSMRDVLLPGTVERWKVSVVNSQGIPVEVAMMSEMYNKSLDAIVTPQPWRLNVHQPYARHFYWSSPNFGSHYQYLFGGVRSLRCQDMLQPEFALYGLGFGMQTFGGIKDNLMATAGGSRVSNMMMRKAAAPAAVELAVMTDSAMAGEAEDAVAVEGSSDGGDAETAQTEFRDAAVTLSFFRPMLVSDHQGNYTIEYTVPQANANWVFRTLAYTADMRSAWGVAEVISRKPIMVKPNPPRFLRQGDNATVITAVMNSTDSMVSNAEVELVCTDLQGNLLASETRAVSIEPKSTVYVSMSISAPDGAGILFMAKASRDEFSDGERVLIPVLEATTPVIESIPFYMAPEQKTEEIELSAATGDVTTTVEFCANPQWYVVTALPGLRRGNILSAPQAASSIFSCAVAEGILRDNPSIAEALKEWTSGDGDESALASLLERNDDMKNLLLSSTPWMTDAQSQTERMARLALLFDKEETAAVYASAIELLKKLKHEDGGWAWIAQTQESSEWATESVLWTLGQLNQLGYFPDNKELSAMVRDAVEFIDRNAAKRVARYPESDMTSYTTLRDMYPDFPLTSDCRRIVASTVQKTVGGWKNIPLTRRPEVAMMLYRHNYSSVAKEILQSLAQFTETTPQKGTWFPAIENKAWGYLSLTAEALDAFTLIEPDSPLKEGLRQWLVMQKQATEWGESTGAALLVASILKAGGDYRADAAGSLSLTVNGKRIPVEPKDLRLGYYRTGIETGSLAAEVVFGKTGEVASWGSVMRRSRQIIADVEAAGTEDLKIEKRLILPEGENTAKVGARVTVELTIRVGRNMNYVTITDSRAACLEPVDQTPYTKSSEGVVFYMEPRDASTNIFVTTMPKGTYVLTYDAVVNNEGEFASGIATVQCQQAAELTAHSSGNIIKVNR